MFPFFLLLLPTPRRETLVFTLRQGRRETVEAAAADTHCRLCVVSFLPFFFVVGLVLVVGWLVGTLSLSFLLLSVSQQAKNYYRVYKI